MKQQGLRSKGRVVASFAVVLALGAGVAANARAAQPAVWVQCTAGERIGPDQPRAEQAALAFLHDFAAAPPAQIYARLSSAARAAASLPAFTEQILLMRRLDLFRDLRPIRTYRIDLTDRRAGPADRVLPMRLGCGYSPDDMAAFAIWNAPTQFVIEVAAHTINNDFAVFVWLVPEQGALKVRSYEFTPTAISGRNSQDLRRLAVEQRARGHLINAAVLFGAAEATAGQTQSVAPVSKEALDKEVSAIRWPAELSGAPVSWRLQGQAYRVDRANVVGIAGALDLNIDRRLDTWTTNAAADTDNRRFIEALIKTHPELSDTFKAIIVRAYEPAWPQNNGAASYATGYEFGHGFDRPK